MFVLTELEDELRIPPSQLHVSRATALTTVIEERYIDRVIPDLGLVITIWDVLEIEGGEIPPNDGGAFFRTKFRLVVFRPFVGEVIRGTIKSCDRNGLRLTVDFFDDILVPEWALHEPSFFEKESSLWFWEIGEGEEGRAYMEIGEEIVVRVTAVQFAQPPTPKELEAAADQGGPQLGTPANPFRPMEVIAASNEDGLGMASWWMQGKDAAEDEAVAEEDEAAGEGGEVEVEQIEE